MAESISSERGADPFVPHGASLRVLAEAARSCHGCPLFARATQTVFGEGAVHPSIVLVGEQPGDVEDRLGHPFVGPAGKLLDRALAQAGIDRAETYVTNVVKHFYWEPRGKRRIHKRPHEMMIDACRPWLEEELARTRPKVLVCLGATAARAILGKSIKVTETEGRVLASPLSERTIATLHPSAILRAVGDTREAQMTRLVSDLKLAAKSSRAGEP